MQLWYWSFSQSEFELPRLDLWRFYSQIIVRKYCSLIGSVATTREISTTCVSLFTLEISTVFEIPVLSLQSCILSTETAFLTLVKKKKKKQGICIAEDIYSWFVQGKSGRQQEGRKASRQCSHTFCPGFSMLEASWESWQTYTLQEKTATCLIQDHS